MVAQSAAHPAFPSPPFQGCRKCGVTMSINLPTVCILPQPTSLSRSALDLRHSTIVASINFKTNSLLYGAFCFRNSPSARQGHWHFYEVLQMRVRLKVAILMQEACEERAREREREKFDVNVSERNQHGTVWYLAWLGVIYSCQF